MAQVEGSATDCTGIAVGSHTKLPPPPPPLRAPEAKSGIPAPPTTMFNSVPVSRKTLPPTPAPLPPVVENDPPCAPTAATK